MAHITFKFAPVSGNAAIAVVVFTSYTNGGEQFTLAEFGLTGSLLDVYQIDLTDISTGTGQDPTGVADLEYVGNGIGKLIGSNGQELPTTPSLSLVVILVLKGT